MTRGVPKRIDRCPLCQRPVTFSQGRAACAYCRIDIQIWFHRYGGNPHVRARA